jgi:hypothetical protein
MLAPPSHWAPVHDHGGPMMLIAQPDVRALDLVAARGLSRMQAIEAVEATGGLPREAVLAGNATLDELLERLASCEPDVAA